MIFPHHIVHINVCSVNCPSEGKKKNKKQILHFHIHISIHSNTFFRLLANISNIRTPTQTNKCILLLYLYMNKCSTAMTTTTTTTETTSKSLSQIYCSNNTSHERFDCNSWARNTHRDTRRPCVIRKIDQKLLRAHRYSNDSNSITFQTLESKKQYGKFSFYSGFVFHCRSFILTKSNNP